MWDPNPVVCSFKPDRAACVYPRLQPCLACGPWVPLLPVLVQGLIHRVQLHLHGFGAADEEVRAGSETRNASLSFILTLLLQLACAGLIWASFNSYRSREGWLVQDPRLAQSGRLW